MKHRWNRRAGSWTTISSLACGLALAATGCGGAPESIGTSDPGSTPGDKGEAPSETAWAQQQFPATWAVVKGFMKVQQELSGRSITRVSALYRPEMEGPAYLEFVLRKDSEDAGFIIASTGGHDVPIYAWAESGSGATHSLAKMNKRDLAGARVFLSGPGKLVAELSDEIGRAHV